MSYENPLSQLIAFTLFGLLLFLCVLSSILRRSTGSTSTARKAPPPPEASGAWPLIGHLPLLGGSKALHVTLGNMADKYGPIFTIRVGVRQALVVNNSEMAKECLSVNDRVFATRPKTVGFQVLGFNFSMMPFSPYGPYWRHVRKIAITDLLSAQRIQKLKHVMEYEVKMAIKESYHYWLRMKSGPTKAVTDMESWFGEISLNVMLRAVVGKRLGGAAGIDDSDHHEENKRIRKAIRDLFYLTGSFIVSDALPYLRWFDLDGQEKKMKKTAQELDYFAQIWLDEHKHKNNSGLGESKGHADFMDALLSSVDQDFGGHRVDTIIKSTCLSLILGGVDTTTITLTWALSLLLNNRKVLSKALQELETKIGRKKIVMECDLKNLVYLQAIIKETLRLYPVAPLNAAHEATEDCVVGGYHVSAGTCLLTNISKIQRDPLIYPDPLEFRPERFLTTHKSVDLKGQHFELIPFSAGRRMCPGVSLALPMTQLILANLLHGFDIATVDGEPVDMAEKVGLTNTKASPLQVILNPRLSASLYGEL